MTTFVSEDEQTDFCQSSDFFIIQWILVNSLNCYSCLNTKLYKNICFYILLLSYIIANHSRKSQFTVLLTVIFMRNLTKCALCFSLTNTLGNKWTNAHAHKCSSSLFYFILLFYCYSFYFYFAEGFFFFNVTIATCKFC